MRSFIAVAIVVLLIIPSIVCAQESGFSVVNFAPATDQTPYLTVYGSPMLPARSPHMGMTLDYAYKPLECDGCPESDIIRHLAVGHFFFAVGATDWLQLGVDIPIVFYNHFFSDETGEAHADGALSDLRFEPKIRLLSLDHYPIGIALLPFVTIPTGDGETFVGNGKVTGGAKVIADTEIAERLSIAMNVGYQVRDEVERSGTRIDDQFLYALAFSIKTLSHLDVILEALGSTVIRDFAEDNAQSPLEVDVGLRYRFDTGLSVLMGGGAGINNGVGDPKVRGIVGVSFTPKR